MKKILFTLITTLGMVAFAGMHISEICPKPEALDPNGLESGWIELYNSGENAENLADYSLIRVNRGKALKAADTKPLAARMVQPGEYTIIYTSEVYPNAKDNGGDDSVIVYDNNVMVLPQKINPKKYPLVALYHGSGETATPVEQVIIPVDLPDNQSVAPGVRGDSDEDASASSGEAPTATATEIVPTALQKSVDQAVIVDGNIYDFSNVTTKNTGVRLDAAIAAQLANGEYTIQFDVRQDYTWWQNTQNSVLFDNRPSQTDNRSGIVVFISGQDQLLTIEPRNSAGSVSSYITGSIDTICDGQNHTVTIVCGQLKDDRIAVYIDGVCNYENTLAIDCQMQPTIPLCFGCAYNSSYWNIFNGEIGNIRLWQGVPAAFAKNNSDGESSEIDYPTDVQGDATKRWILPKITQGAANDWQGATAYGPTAGGLYGVKNAPEDWQAQPKAAVGTDYAVSMYINPVDAANAGDAIVAVKLLYRADFGTIKNVNMTMGAADAAGGQAWTGVIPAADIPAAGHLLRWAAQITDASGNEWRAPAFNDPDNSYEWYGTIVEGGEESATLQTFHIFADEVCLNNMDVQYDSIAGKYPYGARCQIYDAATGYYYDNVRIDVRGNTTKSFPKKSHGLRFNKSQPLTCTDPVTGTVVDGLRKLSFIAEYADPTRIRQALSMKVMADAGMKVPFSYPCRLNLNGVFYQLAWNSNRFTDELIEDYYNFDPYGYSYKNVGTFGVGTSAGGVEKKTPDDGFENDTSVLNAFCNKFSGVSVISESFYGDGTDSEIPAISRIVATDFDLPAWLNYIATAKITHENDDVWANICAYYDVNGTGTWMPLAYDLHLSWGAYYKDGDIGTRNSVANLDWFKSHPFYGGRRVRCHRQDGVSQVGNPNNAYEAIFQSPKYRRLYLRHLRTKMDEILKDIGTGKTETPFWNYVETLKNAIAAEYPVDVQKWGDGSGRVIYDWTPAFNGNQLDDAIEEMWTNYVESRRVHLYGTHSITNTAKTVGYGQMFNAGIPLAQSAIESLTNGFSAVEIEGGVVIRNANDETVDMSGWKLSGPVNMVLPHGTVIDRRINDVAGEIYVVTNRIEYILANSATISDEIIIGNAAIGEGQIGLRGANDEVVIAGEEPVPTDWVGDWEETIVLPPGEYNFQGANFNGGLRLQNGDYKLKNDGKNVVNTAAFIDGAEANVTFTGKGKITLTGTDATLMTVNDLIVSNGTFKIDFTSTVAKSKAVDVNGIFLLDDKGTVDVTVDGLQGYGIFLSQKNKSATIAGGEFKADVRGTSKCAALKVDKGSSDFKLKGGSVNGSVSGIAGKIVNCAGNVKISSGAITAGSTGSEAEILTADKNVEISGGELTLECSEDCINAQQDVVISGGSVYCVSAGGDGIDANGNISISGGTVICYTTAVESDGVGSTGLDVNDGFNINITGGKVVALGGPNSTFHGVNFATLPGFLRDDATLGQLNRAEVSGKAIKVGGETIILPEIANSVNKVSLLYYPYFKGKSLKLLIKGPATAE